MPGFLQDQELKDALAAVLKQKTADLSDNWDRVIVRANAMAWADIVSVFGKTGYAPFQVRAYWSEGNAAQTTLGLFWALAEGGGLHRYEGTAIDRLDLIKRYENLALYDADGVLVLPLGGVGHGALKTTNSEFLDPDYRPATTPGFWPRFKDVFKRW